jgi:hypothetical protein
MLEKINLGEELIIYKIEYNKKYKKEDFIKRVEQNFIVNEGITDDNTSLINIKCKEFESVYTQALESIKVICDIEKEWDGVHLHTNWIYRQNNNSKLQGYHLHRYAHTKAKIINDWSYCFYLSMPENLNNNEGHIKFMDKNNNEYSILPKEGDIIFFSKDTLHTPVLTPASNNYRISICGNISFNVPNVKEIKSFI